jgi:hypothetical protein
MTNIVQAAEADIAKVATVVEHAAAWVLGIYAQAKKDVQDLEASSPLIADAIKLAQTYVAANPIGQAIEATAEEVLALVKQVDSTAAPTSAPTAGSPADPTVNPPTTPAEAAGSAS